jgi:gas vesicle protein
MTHQHTATDHEHASSFAMGLMTGAILGAGLAMLFAPKRGSELRSQLSDTANTFASNASTTYRRAAGAASGWMERGREAGTHAFERAREAVNRGTAEAERYVREATEQDPFASRASAVDPGYRDEGREH